jgi:excinuclease ABC subunit C
MSVNNSLKAKLTQIPHKPGVYLMRDRFGKVIYVGKARDLKKRVSQYFHPSRRQSWDLKLKALIDTIHDLDFFTVRTEAEALLLEGKLIKEFKPKYNISFRDDKRFLMIKVNLNDPVPLFTLTRLKTDDGSKYFGPFVDSKAARSTLALVRKTFHLRACKTFNPTEAEYNHCMYAHLKYCSAPCIGKISTEDYLTSVKEACKFLEGKCKEIEQDLEIKMKNAAATLQFEKAAEYRDLLASLRITLQKNRSFERLPSELPVAINPESDLLDLATVLSLPKPPGRIEGFDISNISGTFSVASMVCFYDGRPARSEYRRYRIKTVPGQDDFACIHEVVTRRYTRVLREQSEKKNNISDNLSRDSRNPDQNLQNRLPDLILIDGGLGQVNAAYSALKKLGLDNISIIGLAKEFEEIYLPHKSESIRLPKNSGALKLLQRIRDESHRFAHTFNARLRLKKINESLLDEFPGIGPKRKTLLLKKFGSVHEIASAKVEDIQSVPGLGGETALQLKTFLSARLNAEPPN